MNLKLIAAVSLVMTLTACNDAGEAGKETKDTVAGASSHGDMHHDMSDAGSVPALPAIPEGARIYFKNLKDGDNVTAPFKIEMGNEIIKIDTAGPLVAGSGHHHLFIDVNEPVAEGAVIPKDSSHLHFGKGQTETELNLSPGKHILTLQFADGLHRSYGNRLSSTITVNVKQ